MEAAETKSSAYLGMFWICFHEVTNAVFLKALQVLYLVQPDTDLGTKTLQAYVKEKKAKKSWKNMCSGVRKIAKDNIQKLDSLDLTFSFPIMKEYCDEFDNLETDAFNVLKDERNRICHLNLESTEPWSYDMFTQELTKLENKILEILKKLEDKFDEEFIKFKKQMCEKIEQCKKCSSIAKFQNRIEQLEKDELTLFIKEGRKELFEKYKGFYEEPIFPFNFLLSDSDETRNVFVASHILNEGEEVKNFTANLLNSKYEEKICILTGPAGSGKSTNARMILQSWCGYDTGCPDIPKDFDFVILVEVNKQMESFSYYVEERILRKTSSFFGKHDFDVVKDLLVNTNVLYVIDGYDERSKMGSALIQEIVNINSESKILITTREEFLQEIRGLANKVNVKCKVYNIEGFDKSSIEKYCSNSFDILNKGYDLQNFQNFLQSKTSLLANHLKIPFILAQLMFLWNDEDSDRKKLERFTSTTQLYILIFKAIQNKLLKRLNSYGNANNKVLNSHDLDKVCDVFYEGAFKLLTQDEDIRYMNNSLDQICQSLGFESTDFKSSFLKVELSQMDSKPSYFFFHISQRDFMGAIHVAKVMDKECETLETILNKTCYGEKFDYRTSRGFFIYLIGYLFHEKKLQKELRNILKCIQHFQGGIIDFNFFWDLLSQIYQSNCDDPFELYGKRFYEQLFKGYLGKELLLNRLNVVAGLNLITYMVVRFEKLTINFDVNPIEILGFEETVFQNEKTLVRKYSKHQIKIALSLRFYIDYPCDNLLKSFSSWIKFDEFSGLLDFKEPMELTRNLKKFRKISMNIKDETTLNEFILMSNKLPDLKYIHMHFSCLNHSSFNCSNVKSLSLKNKNCDIEMAFSKCCEEDKNTIQGLIEKVIESKELRLNKLLLNNFNMPVEKAKDLWLFLEKFELKVLELQNHNDNDIQELRRELSKELNYEILLT